MILNFKHNNNLDYKSIFRTGVHFWLKWLLRAYGVQNRGKPFTEMRIKWEPRVFFFIISLQALNKLHRIN